MARAKKQAPHENHERWLVSYADFITLLFAFFVVMFASSQTDKAKAKQVSDSVREALEHGGVPSAVKEILGGTVDEKGKGNAQMKGPGGAQKSQAETKPPTPPPSPQVAELLPSLQFLSKELSAEIKSGKIEMRLEPRGLVVSLREAAFFPSGGDAVDPGSLSSIQKVAGVLGTLPNPVRLEGHTDSVPIHTARFHNNWELSAARSIAMLAVLSDKFQIPAGRFSVAGYADTAPVASNDDAEGRARNRRVDIVILNRLMAVPDGGPERRDGKKG
ncbi:MAG TPA: flagellar motor protein MotB [Bryobacteraceae bacterium]|jgi:chemotaxis protein MotB|nr:flagellar motor protein MotB [Bryobacteraceae bacterium]